MKKHWKLLLSTLLLVFVLAFVTACGRGGDDNGDDNAGGDTPVENGDAEDEVRDLGGYVVNVATWWTSYCTETAEPDTVTARAMWDQRRAMEETYNFRVIVHQFGSWHDMRDYQASEILAGNRDFQTWATTPSWFAVHQADGLFAPIPLDVIDFDLDVRWTHTVFDLTMGPDGHPYAWSTYLAPTGGVYFNMRLLEEAGVPYDLPFQLLEQNNWTWDTFLDMARVLSRDIDEDGITDIWAITSFHSDMMALALASNQAGFVTVDADGNFVNATNTDAFREVIEFMVQLRDEGLAMHEDDVGGEWNAFETMFNDGQGALRIANHHHASGINALIVDDFGFVPFPRGPRSDLHYAWNIPGHFMVIPHFYSQEEVEKIMFAMARWNMQVEGLDDDAWKIDDLANHRDERSVFFSIAEFTRNPDLQVVPAHAMLPDGLIGENLHGMFAWRVWVDENDASGIIEEAQLQWEAQLADFNAAMGR